MKRLFLFLALLACSGIQAQSKNEAAIRQLLHKQVLAWNEGNIEHFMTGYWKSDSLVFVGSQGIQRGWDATYNRYLKTYDSPEKMGTLDFEILQVKKLEKKTYRVLGKWHLARTMGDVGGFFTLILQKINGEWKIVSDHTS